MYKKKKSGKGSDAPGASTLASFASCSIERVVSTGSKYPTSTDCTLESLKKNVVGEIGWSARGPTYCRNFNKLNESWIKLLRI